MKELKKLLITFDYELFLGKNSGSVSNCIIEPTYEICRVLNAHQIKAVFFVDTMYLVRLKETAGQFQKAKKDYDQINEQLKVLILDGHYIFPHIHAHWLDADYKPDTNTWQLDNLSKYRFNNLDEATKNNVFKRSIDLLYDIIHPLKPDYQVDSYRAGGWCIQPFTDFKPYFETYNIQNDFSVTPGIKSGSNANYYDFTDAENGIYAFKDNVTVAESGPFCEFTVSVLQPNAFQKFIYRVENKFLWKMNIKNRGDGNAAQFTNKPFTRYSHWILSMDTMLRSKMPLYKSFVKNNNYIHFVSHPKMLSQYNINLFKTFLNHIFIRYDIISDFRKMKPEHAAQNSNINRHKAEFH